MSGFSFPAFATVLRKLTMTFFMTLLQEKVDRGELAVEEVLPTFAFQSKMLSVCLTLSNIVMMYLSKSITKCVMAALLSIVTEVTMKVYVVWSTREAVNEQLAIKAVAVANRLQRIAIVEPGAESVANEEEGGDVEHWKERALAAEERALAAEERALAAEAKNRFLKEQNKTLRLKCGEVVEEKEDEDSKEVGGGDGESTDKERKNNWEFVMAMLVARWEKEMASEKSCIIVAAFVVHLFEFSGMPINELSQVLVIFFAAEVVTDFILVYLLDKYFSVPLLRLQHNTTWNETMADMIMTSQILLAVAVGLKVANGIVNGVSE